MGRFVHETTLALVESGNDPDHLDPPWIFIPTNSASHIVVQTVPQIYWKVNRGAGPGAEIEEMTAGEKAAVDAAALTANRDLETEAFDDLESIIRALVLIIMDELNDEFATRINSILAAADQGNYNAFQNAMQAVADAPIRTPAQLRTAIRNRLGT